MANLADLTFHTFAPLAGQKFQVSFGNETVSMTLAEFEDLSRDGSTAGRPFGLVFHGPKNPKWPQATYRFENAAIGTIELFTVPIAEDGSSRAYEVSFN